MTEYIKFKWVRDENGVYWMHREHGFQSYPGARKTVIRGGPAGLNLAKTGDGLFPWVFAFTYNDYHRPIAALFTLKDAKKFAERYFMSEQWKNYGEWDAALDLIGQQEGIEFQRPKEQVS